MLKVCILKMWIKKSHGLVFMQMTVLFSCFNTGTSGAAIAVIHFIYLNRDMS